MNRLSGKSLLLLELSILLVFFLASAGICLNLFVKADGKAKDAEALSEAVVQTTSIAETLKTTGGNLKKTGKYVAGISHYDIVDSSLVIYYDGDMNTTVKANTVYTATVKKEKSGKTWEYLIWVENRSSQETVYKLTFSTIRGGGASK